MFRRKKSLASGNVLILNDSWTLSIVKSNLETIPYCLHRKKRCHQWHFNFTFDIWNKQLLCLSLIIYSISSKSIISLDAQ